MPTLAIISKETLINYAYLAAAVMFILGLKRLSAVKTARQGNMISALGMLVAAAATLFLINDRQLVALIWIAAGLALGSVIGLLLAFKTPMTGMPQMVALLNGFGGIASLLVAYGDYWTRLGNTQHIGAALQGMDLNAWYPPESLFAAGLTILVGGITFTGSLVAFGKLQGLRITPSKPVQFTGQKAIIGLLVLTGVVLSVVPVIMRYQVESGAAFNPLESAQLWGVLFGMIAVLALLLGILLVIGIGGADMPVVVSLLNSYSGIAAALAGFVLTPPNNALIITGALVGASGLILTNIMCVAMNRSLANVLFGGVGGAPASSKPGAAAPTGNVKSYTPEDARILLEAASQVMIVPGYGMAVAQAQHGVKELADALEQRGITVRFAIHPVAGRMPGHMNVLLAEASVPYDHLLDLEGANPEFERTDVALVIGANDVTNPAARHAKDSPIYGMPILDVDKARQVLVIKRSMSAGFAGVDNELYFADNCAMLFGDAKAMVNQLVAALKTG